MSRTGLAAAMWGFRFLGGILADLHVPLVGVVKPEQGFRVRRLPRSRWPLDGGHPLCGIVGLISSTRNPVAIMLN